MIFEHFRAYGIDAYAHEHRSLYKASARIDIYFYDGENNLIKHCIIRKMPKHKLKEWMLEHMKDVSKCQSQ